VDRGDRRGVDAIEGVAQAARAPSSRVQAVVGRGRRRRPHTIWVSSRRMRARSSAVAFSVYVTTTMRSIVASVASKRSTTLCSRK
jgi:hypothetical protein